MLIQSLLMLAQRARLVARTDRGATAVEYGLMVALIAAVIVGAVILLGQNLSGLFGGVAGDVKAP